MKRLQPIFKKAALMLRAAPFRLCFGVVLLLHVIGEEYPFSNFPMYSNFQRDARVIWIGDQNGKPVATSPYFALRVSTLKKIFDTRVTEAKRQGLPLSDDSAAHAAAALVLEELWEGRRPGRLEKAGVSELRFMEQNFWFEDEKLQETERELARLALPSDAAKTSGQ